MTQSETRYEIMECEDANGFNPSGLSELTRKEAEAELRKYRKQFPKVYRNAFICKTVTTRI